MQDQAPQERLNHLYPPPRWCSVALVMADRAHWRPAGLPPVEGSAGADFEQRLSAAFETAGVERRNPMRRLVLAFIVLAVLGVGAGIAYSASSPGAKLQKQDRVWGGGHFPAGCSIPDPATCIVNPRNVAVDAHAEGNGSEAAGNSTYGSQTARTVTCLAVNGNAAAIGGMSDASNVYVQYFVDRGTTELGTPQHDLVSLTLNGPLGDSSFPAGFPFVCPPATGSPSLPAYYFEIDGGDITVQDAPTS